MASRQAKPAGEQVEEPGQPTPILPEAQVSHPDEPEPMREGEITTMESLMGQQEIEVDPVQDPGPQPPDPSGLAIIRMNTTLEDFTYGDPSRHYKLEAGKRYRLPVHIAQYLDGLGYVWH